MTGITGVFQGIRVVEVSRGIAGALTGLLLADYGAEVTVVEPPGGHPLRADDTFAVYARGKQSVVADIDATAGAALVREWVGRADVAIVEMTPDRALRNHISYVDVARDDLVYAAITPFGASGPMTDIDGDEHAAAAFAGLMMQQEAMDLGPVFLTLPIASTATAILTATGIATALRVRARTGAGQQVSTSLFGGALALSPDALTTVSGRFGTPARLPDEVPELQGKIAIGRRWKVGDPLGSMPVFRLYRASDDYFALACGGDYFWHRLCMTLGHPEWIGDPRFENAPWGIPRAHRDWLVARLTEIFATRTRADWLEALRAADIPAAPVATRREFLTSRRVRDNRLSVEVMTPDGGTETQPGSPLQFDGAPVTPRGPAPDLGAHNAWPERARTPGTAAIAGRPLEGIRVLDLTTWVGGSYGPAILADLGADVVKVESPDGDPMRSVAIGYMGINRGKRSVVLDLKSGAGRDATYQLIRRADVVVQNYRPGVAERLGLDLASVRRINPGAVYAATSAHGATGEHAKEPGFDILFQALSGACRAQGGDGPPVYLTNTLVDFTAGLLSAFGVAAGLYRREVSGEAPSFEGSLLAAALTVQLGGFGPGRAPDLGGGIDFRGPSPLLRLYRVSDGWVLVDARSRPAALATAFGVTGDDVTAVEEVLGRLPAHTVVHALAKQGATAVIANDWSGLAGNPQVLANELEERHAHPVWGEVVQVAPVIRLNDMPSTVARPSPMLGEHTREVLLETGFATPAIDAMVAAGAAVQGSVEAERARITFS